MGWMEWIGWDGWDEQDGWVGWVGWDKWDGWKNCQFIEEPQLIFQREYYLQLLIGTIVHLNPCSVVYRLLDNAYL